MNIIKDVRAIAVSALVLASLVLPTAAQQPTKIDFSSETVGAEPKSLVAVVGIWRIEGEGGKNVLAVDGRQWKEGQSSAGVADKARAL
jgi:predicted S18 family serine protease